MVLVLVVMMMLYLSNSQKAEMNPGSKLEFTFLMSTNMFLWEAIWMNSSTREIKLFM